MAKRANRRQRWEPSISDFIAIGAIAMGVILWLTAPGWKIGVPVALVTLVLFTFAGIRHSGSKIARTIVTAGAIAIFIFLVAPPMWDSFRKDYPQIPQYVGAPAGIELSVTERLQYLNKGSPVLLRDPNGSTLLMDVMKPLSYDAVYHTIILHFSNRLASRLSNVSLTLTKADGLMGPDLITTPKKLSIDHELNPTDARDIVIAGYLEQPPSADMCLDVGGDFPCGLWSAKDKVDFTFFATAAESVSATITVRVWIDDDHKLRHKVL